MATDRQNHLLQTAYNAGITSPKELANFMAQVGHESGNLSRLNESFRYTKSAEQVSSVVRSAMREGRASLEEARLEALDGKPQALAELMYGGRMGNDQPGDGYQYRGRGYIQLTGKNQYEAAGQALGMDLVKNPDLAAEPENAARIAVWYWQQNVPAQTRENVRTAGAAINGANPPNGLADREQKFDSWQARLTPELMGTLQAGSLGRGTPAPAAPAIPAPATGSPAATTPGNDLLNETRKHFFESGRQYEYGRPDVQLKAGNDRSRLERDSDGDGRFGVDCSAFVWRGLKNAGFAVPGDSAANFTTHSLFVGNNPTAFAKQNFDTIAAGDARKPNGDLQPGDLILFKSRSGSGQHIGVFSGYDQNGNIKYLGSQVSTGPDEVTIRPGGYWDGKTMDIVGALRPKESFQVREPVHGSQAPVSGREPATTLLREGNQGNAVQTLQSQLNQLGFTDGRGRALATDGKFGNNTEQALEAFQKANGLKADGVVGPLTRQALENALQKAPQQATPAPAASLQDMPLFQKLKGCMPDGLSLEKIGQATTCAIKAGIDSAEKVQQVHVNGNMAHVIGTTAGFRASVDLAVNPPSLEASNQQLLALNQEREQQRSQSQAATLSA